VLWGCALALYAAGVARAEEASAPEPEAPPPLQLEAPDLRHAAAPLHAGLDLAARDAAPGLHPLRLSLDLGVTMLRLAVHGDYRPGLAPFLGTSTTSLGGLRLRF
jgi:hypothetical protein